MAVKILLKRGSRQSWEAIGNKPESILSEGELGYEKIGWDDKGYLVTGGLKIGNGKSTWNELPYINKFIVTYDDFESFP